VFLTNIRLGRKGLPSRNTPAWNRRFITLTIDCTIQFFSGPLKVVFTQPVLTVVVNIINIERRVKEKKALCQVDVCLKQKIGLSFMCSDNEEEKKFISLTFLVCFSFLSYIKCPFCQILPNCWRKYD